jgi:hypothetical protein
MREASGQLDSDNLTQDNISAAKRKISEGMDLIKNRQKLIKLADSSDAGWRVVDEHVSNPLAEDSDDEKKIYKAQTRAESKLKKEKAKRNGRTNQKITPYDHTKKHTTTGNTITVELNALSRPGRYFYCMETGHWRQECPKALAEEKRKISIDFSINSSLESSTPMFTKQISRDTNMSTGNTHTTIDSKFIRDFTPDLQVGVGNLLGNIEKWKDIGANEYIIDVIENGYKIPFLHIPDSIALDNNKSSRDNTKFVTEEIEKLINKGCVSPVTEKPYVVNPLTVAHDKGSKWRLVLDARHINPHLLKFKHKYEDAVTARQLFNKGNWVFSYDLKSAYHHLQIFPADRIYLGFQWKNRYYAYNVLPFGLATSGYIFSKVTREIVKYWRGKGFKIIMYLHDGLEGATSYEEALSTSKIIKFDLEQFGFHIAQEKCIWTPVQKLD